MRIVDQPLPANRGARLFKIDAHDDFHFVGEFLLQFVHGKGVGLGLCGLFQKTLSNVEIAVVQFNDGPISIEKRIPTQLFVQQINARYPFFPAAQCDVVSSHI